MKGRFSDRRLCLVVCFMDRGLVHCYNINNLDENVQSLFSKFADDTKEDGTTVSEERVSQNTGGS